MEPAPQAECTWFLLTPRSKVTKNRFGPFPCRLESRSFAPLRMTGENVILSAAKNLSPLRGEEFFPGIVKDALPFLYIYHSKMDLLKEENPI